MSCSPQRLAGYLFFKPDESHAATRSARILSFYPSFLRFLPLGPRFCGIAMVRGLETVRARCGVDASILREDFMPFPARLFFERALGLSRRHFLLLRREPGYGRALPCTRQRDLVPLDSRLLPRSGCVLSFLLQTKTLPGRVTCRALPCTRQRDSSLWNPVCCRAGVVDFRFYYDKDFARSDLCRAKSSGLFYPLPEKQRRIRAATTVAWDSVAQWRQLLAADTVSAAAIGCRHCRPGNLVGAECV